MWGLYLPTGIYMLLMYTVPLHPPPSTCSRKGGPEGRGDCAGGTAQGGLRLQGIPLHTYLDMHTHVLTHLLHEVERGIRELEPSLRSAPPLAPASSRGWIAPLPSPPAS